MKSYILNIKNKEESLQKSIEKAKEVQEKCNVFVTMLNPTIKEEQKSLLSNVPYVLKDNYSTKGILTTASSNMLKDYIPPFNSTVYQKLEDAGAILIGKSVLDEFGMGGTGTTGHTGIVKNPYDEERIAGGSSAGSAVSVASNMVPFAIGSDTGDSVRKPAAYCGIVGYKPTYGMISRWGLLPFASSLDHVGIFAKSVYDASIVADVLKGKDEHDMTTFSSSSMHLKEAVEKPFTHAKLCYIKEIVDLKYYEEDTSKEIIHNFEDLIQKLKKENIEVEEVSIPYSLLEVLPSVYTCISCAEATSNLSNLTGIPFGPSVKNENVFSMIKENRTIGFSPLIKRRFVIGSYVLQKENQERYFVNAQKIRMYIVNKMKEIFQTYDGVILPCSSSVAPYIKDVKEIMNKKNSVIENHMVIGNFGGFPSITIPCGMIEDLPIGINITSNIYQDETLLHIANKIEEVIDFKGGLE